MILLMENLPYILLPYLRMFVMYTVITQEQQLVKILNLYQPRARLNITSKSLSTMGVKIWNCLPLSIRNLSKSTFKKKCKRMLLEILNTCDDYVDLAYIMQTASTVS